MHLKFYIRETLREYGYHSIPVIDSWILPGSKERILYWDYRKTWSGPAKSSFRLALSSISLGSSLPRNKHGFAEIQSHYFSIKGTLTIETMNIAQRHSVKKGIGARSAPEKKRILKFRSLWIMEILSFIICITHRVRTQDTQSTLNSLTKSLWWAQ